MMMIGNLTLRPTGPIVRLPDGRIRFQGGGTLEYEGVERRIEATDELFLVLDDGVANATVLVNGIPLDRIGLDS